MIAAMVAPKDFSPPTASTGMASLPLARNALLSKYVRPYVKAQKNDDRDAETIAEAATRPTMRFVTLKSEAQLDMQTLHRVPDQLIGERTALMNQIRAILLERGHVVPQGRAKLAACLHALTD